jgi:hypothetical protein
MAREARTSMLVSELVLSWFFLFLLTHLFCLIGNPLAQGFNLNDGEVEFYVPDVVSGTNYIVARTCLVFFYLSLRCSPAR